MYLLTLQLAMELQPVRSGSAADPVIAVGQVVCDVHRYRVSGALPHRIFPLVTSNTPLINHFIYCWHSCDI